MHVMIKRLLKSIAIRRKEWMMQCRPHDTVWSYGQIIMIWRITLRIARCIPGSPKTELGMVAEDNGTVMGNRCISKDAYIIFKIKNIVKEISYFYLWVRQ